MSDVFESPIKGCEAEGRNISVITCKCPKCQEEVEMFTDEKKIKCSNCGEEITIEKCRENQI